MTLISDSLLDLLGLRWGTLDSAKGENLISKSHLSDAKMAKVARETDKTG